MLTKIAEHQVENGEIVQFHGVMVQVSFSHISFTGRVFSCPCNKYISTDTVCVMENTEIWLADTRNKVTFYLHNRTLCSYLATLRVLRQRENKLQFSGTYKYRNVGNYKFWMLIWSCYVKIITDCVVLWKIQKFDWLISVLKSVPFLHECHFGSAWMSFWPAMLELPGETRIHSSRVEPEKTIDSKSIKTFHCLTERWYVAIIACCDVPRPCLLQ